MDELIHDVNGIWVDKIIKAIFYPTEGYDDCFYLKKIVFGLTIDMKF
jgi:hypothetical protein